MTAVTPRPLPGILRMRARLTGKPALILHAGFHKTGTSAIQSAFSRLEMGDIQYADWGSSPNHSGAYLFGFMEPKSAIYGVGTDPEALRRADTEGAARREELLREIRQTRKPAVMISAEEMGTAQLDHVLKAFRDFCRPHVSGFQLHCYIRPPRRQVATTFQQLVRMGTPFRFLPKVAPIGPRIASFERIFGPGNVCLYKYDREALVDGDIVRDFATRLGLPVPSMEPFSENRSLQLNTMAVLFCGLHLGNVTVQVSDLGGFHTRLLNRLEPLGGGAWSFSSALEDEAVKYAENDLDYVEWRLGTSLRDHGDRSGTIVESRDHLLRIAGEMEDAVFRIAQATCAVQGAATADLERASQEESAPRRVAEYVDAMKRALALELGGGTVPKA